jgi:hypothetical protein
VLTSSAPHPQTFIALDQPLAPLGEIAPARPETIIVIQHPPAPTPKHLTRISGKRGRRRGGWPSSPSLSWKDVQAIHEIAHRAGRSRLEFTHMITIMPDSGDDVERKRESGRIVGHLGQALKRHGKPHVGLTVYEKSLGGDLHAHHLVHIPAGEEGLVYRLHDLPKVHVRRVTTKAVGYVTKERAPLPPSHEAHNPHRRKKGARLPGKRWTATSAARRLVEA